MLSRRDAVRLSCLAAPVLLTRCVESRSPLPPEASEGRLHARPDLFEGTSPAAPTARPQRLQLSAGGRDGVFFAPRDADALILYLHGAGGNGAWAVERLIEEAERLRAVIVAPDSRQTTWGFDGAAQAADLAFIDDALETLFASHRIDPRRVGISGFSDGASVALSWGLMNGDLFPGIAAFSPGFVHLSGPAVGRPRVFISHGTRDQVLPVERCGRRVAQALKKAGYAVDYREFDGEHTIPPPLRRAGLESLAGR